MTTWKQVKRRGVLSPEQPDFKERRLKAIKRRHRVMLRALVADILGDDTEGGSMDEVESLFD